MEKPRVLIIEDNEDTRRLLEVMLEKDFQVSSAENAIIGIDYARNHSPDVILLDIMLPILSGYDACNLLKKDPKTKHIPIIFLSAKNTVNDITEGLDTGADDYIPKPFNHKELVARIRARLRKKEETQGQPFTLGNLHIDPASREVTFDGKQAQLTLTEFDLLRYLAMNAGNIVTRESIMKEIWKEKTQKTTDRTIDVHVRALRKKIPALSRHIISIYGVGYKYEQ